SKTLQHGDVGMTHDHKLHPGGQVASHIRQVFTLVESLRRERDRLESHLERTALERNTRPQTRRRKEQSRSTVNPRPSLCIEMVDPIKQFAQTVPGPPLQ